MATENRTPYADIEDIEALWRPLTEAEKARALSLLPIISDRIRFEAAEVGMDYDAILAEDPVLASVAKGVTVDVVARTLMTPTSSGAYGPMTQISESAGGYSASGTFLNPGGGLFLKRDELRTLGIRRQRYGGLGIYADPWNPDNAL